MIIFTIDVCRFVVHLTVMKYSGGLILDHRGYEFLAIVDILCLLT